MTLARDDARSGSADTARLLARMLAMNEARFGLRAAENDVLEGLAVVLDSTPRKRRK
jgi:hypothetical protein